MDTAVAEPASMVRVAGASFVGALLEWYDFYIFATGSALVFGRLFFPREDPVVGTMAAFGAFAAGFLARPLGGLLFGHIGDRVGRKASLLATLLIIGFGTLLIGLLPTWSQAGYLAPVCLIVLRVAQGIGLGGEYGGAALLTIEHAPHATRGFWGSLPQAASPAGLLLSSAMFGVMSLLPQESFLAWGWRVPFLASLPMLAVGVFIRLRIAETPEFLAVQQHDGPRRDMPMLQLLRRDKRATLLALGARLAETVSGNMVKSFGLTYATLELGLPQEQALTALLATSGVALVATPLFGWLGDRIGMRSVYLLGAGSAAVLSFPFFWLLDARTITAVWVAFIVAYTLGPTQMLSVQPAFFSSMFQAEVRYTALSVAYQVSAILGGFVPLIALSLLRVSGGAPWLVAGMLALIAMLSFGCVMAAYPRPRAAY